jgi:hypothetical protein
MFYSLVPPDILSSLFSSFFRLQGMAAGSLRSKVFTKAFWEREFPQLKDKIPEGRFSPHFSVSCMACCSLLSAHLLTSFLFVGGYPVSAVSPLSIEGLPLG